MSSLKDQMVDVGGMLICIEGTDGSGKGTQAKTLTKTLETMGYEVVHLEFPRYTKNFFGKEVGKFLDGQYGELKTIHPKIASMIYAGDRYETRDFMRSMLEDGVIIVCDRYVGSNMAYQCTRLPEDEQVEMRQWLEELEYGIYRLPKPDMTIFLDVPVGVSKQLVLMKAKRSYTDKDEDIMEAQHDLLEKVYLQYKALSNIYNWRNISCMMHQQIESIDTLLPENIIADRIQAQVNIAIAQKLEIIQD